MDSGFIALITRSLRHRATRGEGEAGRTGLLDELVWLLADGRWHELEEIPSRLDAPDHQVQKGARFLAEYGFIEYDELKERVRATTKTRAWLRHLGR